MDFTGRRRLVTPRLRLSSQALFSATSPVNPWISKDLGVILRCRPFCKLFSSCYIFRSFTAVHSFLLYSDRFVVVDSFLCSQSSLDCFDMFYNFNCMHMLQLPKKCYLMVVVGSDWFYVR